MVGLLFSTVLVFAACSKSDLEKNGSVKEVFKIGAILPLTGPAASAGTDSKNGLVLAVEEINKSQKFNKSIELVIEDSKAEAKEAVSALNKINLSDKAIAIYTQLSNVSLAIKPITERSSQVLIAVSGAGNLTEDSRNTYRNYIKPSYYSEAVSQMLKDSLGVEKIGVLYANTEFGKSIKSNIVNSFEKNSIETIFEVAYDEKSNDLKSTILKGIGKYSVKNIYVIGVGKSLGILIKQLRELNYEGRIIGGIEVPYPDVLNIAEKAANGLIYVDLSFDANNITAYNKSFVAAYREKYNKLPTTSSALAYDAMNLLFDAVKLQGINEINLNLLNYPKIGVNGNIFVEENDIYYELALKKININD